VPPGTEQPERPGRREAREGVLGLEKLRDRRRGLDAPEIGEKTCGEHAFVRVAERTDQKLGVPHAPRADEVHRLLVGVVVLPDHRA
jgi:hypothetical protein